MRASLALVISICVGPIDALYAFSMLPPERVPSGGRWALLIMSDTRIETPSKFATWFFFLTGSYSLVVPLIITPIALVRLSAANHGHPIFGWALSFYLSSVITGAMSLIVVWKIRRYAMLWLPLVGVTFSGALAFLAFFFWAMSG